MWMSSFFYYRMFSGIIRWQVDIDQFSGLGTTCLPVARSGISISINTVGDSMKSQLTRGKLMALGAVAIALFAVPILADPCLVVYPTANCIYHYDINEYYTVGPGDPLYDPLYDRGGEVLLELGSDEVDLSIYQAPGLVGFTPSSGGNDGYFFTGHNFDLVVDGFNNAPTTYVNVLLVFEPDPDWCSPLITIDGNPALYDPGLGWYYPVGDLVVTTPTGTGNNYSDTISFPIYHDLCIGMTMWAFSDENYNLDRTGGECFSAYSHDATVPTDETTWGGIKALFEK